MFKTILVPVDGSQTASEALSLAISLARDQKAKLICCYALEEVALISAATQPTIDPTFAIDQADKHGASVVAEAVEQAKAAGVEVDGQVVEDDPIPMILKLAKEKQADLIVLGTHGRRGFERALMGSTTEGVLRQADIPVLAIRHKNAKMRM
jgi:nucleotide-binding universal stress UspA family protein